MPKCCYFAHNLQRFNCRHFTSRAVLILSAVVALMSCDLCTVSSRLLPSRLCVFGVYFVMLSLTLTASSREHRCNSTVSVRLFVRLSVRPSVCPVDR